MYNCFFENANVKLFVCDFDGIFTNGKITVYSNGTTSKQMDYKDIMAIACLLRKNIKFAIISGETSSAIELLKNNFPDIDIFQNQRCKIQILKDLLCKYNISPRNTLYMGDDINDIECLKFVGFPVTVNDANEKVKNIDGIFITSNNGGNAAVREVTDYLLC